MYSSIQLAKKFVRYYLTALNGKGHGMHSPFVFQFIRHVLMNSNKYTPPPSVEMYRKTLQSDERVLSVEDFGAGSRVAKQKQRTVAGLARSALKPAKYARLLFRLVKHYQPSTIVELGTSLGLTTAYLSMAKPDARLVTIEGSEAIQGVAMETFSALHLPNVQPVVGNFDDVLPAVLSDLTIIDFAYIDGNHRYEPTVRYFHQLLSSVNNNSILVFDDIHWSEEMEKAWQEIKRHPSVRCTVDVFFLGFVFFRQEFKEKQHFTVRF